VPIGRQPLDFYQHLCRESPLLAAAPASDWLLCGVKSSGLFRTTVSELDPNSEENELTTEPTAQASPAVLIGWPR
jgi:hypothetical protein